MLKSTTKGNFVSELFVDWQLKTISRRTLWSSMLCLFILFSYFKSYAQNELKNSYWIQLKDKTGTQYQISHPEDFLSQRAIDRRIKQHIAIDETDLPVSAVYLDTLIKSGLEVVHTSKWLNGVTVRTADTALIQQIDSLPFVISVQLTKSANILKSSANKFEEEYDNKYNPADYGGALDQLTLMNGQYFHSQGVRGKGIQIAVLDAGFWSADTIAAFDSLRIANHLLGIRDFVDSASDFYKQHTHGTSVLSCMAGNLPGKIIGTAPDASFYLFRTEDAATEYPIEEDNWVAAAELADSVGVDIINSSLGYSIFDDPQMSHTYAEMNGRTTRVTQAANMAFKKGILVFASAGNEASNSWQYIIAPADGENVLAVGAVDKTGIRASFSSVGPAFGGAIKPNIAALGSFTFLVTSAGITGNSSGTSFSSPVMAGMGACLLQANPYASVSQLKMAIEESATQYNNPDSVLGYGIPDFGKADQYLKVNSSIQLSWANEWTVVPNPFHEYILLHNTKNDYEDKLHLCIYNLQGICLYQTNIDASETVLLNNLANLPNGFLILSISSKSRVDRMKVLKTP